MHFTYNWVHFTYNWVDLEWVYYFKEQEFKFSIETMQIYPKNK